MKTILVPIDFSENSKNEMDYAIMLATHLKMKILLLHAFHPSLPEAIGDTYKLMGNKDITGTPLDVKRDLETWKQAVLSSNKELKCETIFCEGPLDDEISRVMMKRKIDMIVMETKGAEGFRKAFSSTQTMKVIEIVNCPVVVVPPGFKFRNWDNIVFATDYRESDDQSIMFLGQLAKSFGSGLDVVHILENQSQAGADESLSENFVKGVAKEIKYDGIKFHCLNGTGIHETLRLFITERKADLLAISFTDRSLMTSLFKSGLTWELVYHPEIPLMVLPLMQDEELHVNGQSAY